MRLFGVICWIPGMRSLLKKIYCVNDTSLERNLAGLRFDNPVGLAAGFDKDARYFRLMEVLGFGHIELGTVTPLPQIGNPKPRLFRLPKDRALINRMGFNNSGIEGMVTRLKTSKNGIPIGINIGKNKNTPNEEPIADYEKCFTALFPFADYFTINVSSPNTPGLRSLQEKEPLTNILDVIAGMNREMPDEKPIFLKIAPDLTNEALEELIDIALEAKITGIIATNTTISRASLKTKDEKLEQIGPGGLSGAPLKDRSTEVIKLIAARAKGNLKIIAAGGIMSGPDALEKLRAGADLVQIYTGMIYKGPALVRDINSYIKHHIKNAS